MENVINILMNRDGMTRDEARELVIETREMLLSADVWEADEIIADQLGLEPDYIMDILGY
jgi:hypothetical protein